MAEPFIGEIRIFGFNFAPRSWAFCDGHILPINQYQALFSLLGTTYGGDGRTTFGLPDLRGRAAIHANNDSLGAREGEEQHTLTVAEMPAHTHAAHAAAATGNSPIPTGTVLARNLGQAYAAPPADTTAHADAISRVGANQAHENMQPYLAVSFCIALTGLFPPRN